MIENDALKKLIPPGKKRPWKKHNLEGVMQIIVTTSCDKSCASCTQMANIKRPHWEMKPEDFEFICQSLRKYFGVVALFGGNPCLAKSFPEYCKILSKYFPKTQRGLWSNHIFGHGELCRKTFGRWNLNPHGDKKAWENMRKTWPEAKPMGPNDDSRHSPVFVSMRELDELPFPDGSRRENTEENRWELISKCDLNYHWSGAVTVIQGQPVGYFCEIAAAQALRSQDPTTGMIVVPDWWKKPMQDFAGQARQHCHRCSVPLKGHGELSTKQDGMNVISPEYADMNLKGKQLIQITTNPDDLHPFGVKKVTQYRQNVKV